MWLQLGFAKGRKLMLLRCMSFENFKALKNNKYSFLNAKDTVKVSIWSNSEQTKQQQKEPKLIPVILKNNNSQLKYYLSIYSNIIFLFTFVDTPVLG